MNLEILPPNDETLYQPVEKEVEDINGAIAMSRFIVKKLHTDWTDGLAIAATQLGIRERFFVFADGRIFINPKIDSPKNNRIKTTPEQRIRLGEEPLFQYGEGCLSFPGKQVIVPRFHKIKATWVDGAGKQHNKERLSGLDAIIFQHELDHLDGICIINQEEAKELYESRNN